MMIMGGPAHFGLIVASIILTVILVIIVAKTNIKVQNFIITFIGLTAVLGIFFLHGTHYFTDLDLQNLGRQMFQVCNFNFILIPIALFKRNELARQYLFFFSMPSALSTFVTFPAGMEKLMWYSVPALTFWINHLFCALTPILMVASRMFKPQIKYVPKVLICMLLYFGSAFLANYAINGWSIEGNSNLSFTMNASSVMVLKPLFNLIPIPFVYLLPLLPAFAIIFYLIALAFKKYKLKGTFGYEFKKK